MQGDEGARPRGSFAQAQGVAPPCATHADRPATGICQRCGNYTCGLCIEEGRRGVCAACRERLGLTAFPMSRDRWSIADLFGYAWHVFKREWETLTLASLIFLGGIVVVATVTATAKGIVDRVAGPTASEELGLSVFLTVVRLAVSGWLQVGVFAIAIKALEGRPVRALMVFGQYRKIGKILIQWLAYMVGFVAAYALLFGVLYFSLRAVDNSAEAGNAAELLAMLLMVVPTIYVFLGIAFMEMELALDDEVGALEAMRRSWVVARSKRGWILLLGLVAGVIAASGVVALCVGVIATLAFGQLMMMGFYLALRNGAGVPAPTRLGSG